MARCVNRRLFWKARDLARHAGLGWVVMTNLTRDLGQHPTSRIEPELVNHASANAELQPSEIISIAGIIPNGRECLSRTETIGRLLWFYILVIKCLLGPPYIAHIAHIAHILFEIGIICPCSTFLVRVSDI